MTTSEIGSLSELIMAYPTECWSLRMVMVGCSRGSRAICRKNGHCYLAVAPMTWTVSKVGNT